MGLRFQDQNLEPFRICLEKIPQEHHSFAFVRLFDRVASGIGVQLDGWGFPICIESDGNLLFDNFQGLWGAQEKLDKFQQAYAVEKAKLEVRKQGYQCSESVLADGSIRLNILVGV